MQVSYQLERLGKIPRILVIGKSIRGSYYFDLVIIRSARA